MIAKVIYLTLITFSLWIRIARHGEVSKPSNGYIAFISYLMTIGLLYCGGFLEGLY